MANLVACPKCSAQLSLPTDGPLDAQIQCPLCDEAFPLSATKRTRVAEAVLVTPPATSAEGKTTTPEPKQETPKQEPKPAPTELFGTIELTPRAAPPKPAAAPESDTEAAPTDAPLSLADEQPIPSTLSDWLKKEPTDAKPLSDPHKTTEVAPSGTKPPVEASDAAPSETAQPSLESLLSSFRGATPSPSPQSNAGESADVAPGSAGGWREDESAEPSGEAPGDDSHKTTTFSSIGTVSEFAPVDAPASAGTQEAMDKAPTRESESLAKDFQFDIGSPATSSEDSGAYAAAGNPTPTMNRRAGRRSLPLQTLAVLLGGGAGIALGYLGLLWFKGPEGDVLGASRYLPAAVLPSSFAAARPEAPSTEDPMGVVPAPLPANPSDGTPLAGVQDDKVAPASFDETPRPRAAGGPNEPRLLDAPGPYSLVQLRQTLAGAEEARRLMSEQSLAANPEAAKELGGAYAKLCQVALVLSFVEEPANNRDMTSLEAKEIYHLLFQYGHARDDARDMATRWLAWGDRAHGGVFFAGKLLSGEQLGELYQYKVQLTGEEPVVVLSENPISPERFLRAESIGVVGTIVESPAQRIRGYTGDAERAVWACHSISLGEPQFD